MAYRLNAPSLSFILEENLTLALKPPGKPAVFIKAVLSLQGVKVSENEMNWDTAWGSESTANVCVITQLTEAHSRAPPRHSRHY